MDRTEYNKAINKNTLECWGIILSVLLISYSIEVFRGLRTIAYFAFFLSLMIIPYVGALLHYRKNKANLNLKHIFIISYMLLYTFVLLTTRTYVTYTYVIPMVSILVAYCDNKTVIATFTYVMVINLVSIYYQYIEFTEIGKALIFTLKDRITMWEIQVASLLLSGIFLAKATSLIKKRDEILDVLSDDVQKDALTGVYNKKFLEQSIMSLYKSNKNKSVAFIDIDDFKKFNTLYGHNFGDEVLIALCECISNEIDKYKNTYLVRVGGDEFIIFSLDFNKKDFTRLLEDVLKSVAATKLPYGKKHVSINITAGLASSEEDKCKDFTELYNLADKRNGKAKKNGKNYVEYK